MAWYQDWFGEQYLELYAHRDSAEAECHVELLLRNLAPQRPRRVLDVACGAGRHLSQLHARAIEAYGIDLSLDLLAHYQGRPGHLLQADMRALPFAAHSFDVLTSFFTSFGYFESDEAHQTLLQEWNRVLCKEGYLYIDYLNREQIRSSLLPETRKTVDSKQVIELRTISDDGTRIEKQIQIEDGKTGARQTFFESVRMYSKSEMEQMLNAVGFELRTVFGNMHGAPYSESSPRLIVLAQLKE